MSNKEQSTKIIQSMIANVKLHHTKFVESVQVCAVTIMCHAINYGDWRKANDLVDAIGEGVRGTSLVKWFEEFAGLEKSGKGFIGWRGAEFAKKNLEQAKATKWHKMEKPINPFDGYNASEDFLRVIKKYKSMQKRMETMDADDKAKVNMTLNDTIIQDLLRLANFEKIVIEETPANTNKDAA